MEAPGPRRVTYDLFWGLVLLATCAVPQRGEAGALTWSPWPAGGWWVGVWLLANALAGAVVSTAGIRNWRGRGRHLLNFGLGVGLLALPAAVPAVWDRFPAASPAALPLGDLASVGWVVFVALVAIYAGSGIRIVRPGLIAGQALCGLGALVLFVFAFLPLPGHEHSFAIAQLRGFTSGALHWQGIAPFLLSGGAVVCGVINLVRSPVERQVARLARLTLVGALMTWAAAPLLGAGAGSLRTHAVEAWGTLRYAAPLFLALDGCIAFVAISFTRSE